MKAPRRPHQVALTNVFQEKLCRRRERGEVEGVAVFARGSGERSDLQLIDARNAVFGFGIFGARDEEGCAFSHDESVL